MSTTDHNRMIKDAAKSALGPLGCVQKGNSRIWLDPHPLWVGVIEFQPSGWETGSYLNVGACWHWYAKDTLSFDYGGRVAAFESCVNKDTFAQAALALAEQAREEVLALRSMSSSLDHISATLKSSGLSSIWQNYHAAIAATLANDLTHASKRFSAIEEQDNTVAWAVELKKRAAALADLSPDSQRFGEAIHSIVTESKFRLKLT